MEYNVTYETTDITVIKGDTIDLPYSVKRNGVLYDMTGMQIDVKVRTSDVNKTVLATWSSAGTSPAITISGSSFRIYDEAGITTLGQHRYDIQLTNGTVVHTMRKGYMYVIDETTT